MKEFTKLFIRALLKKEGDKMFFYGWIIFIGLILFLFFLIKSIQIYLT